MCQSEVVETVESIISKYSPILSENIPGFTAPFYFSLTLAGESKISLQNL